jgi:outer membrane immunogenic protein
VTRIAFAIRIAAVAFSITPAVAADLGRLPPAGFYPPTPMVRVYNWTGCYLGAQLGGAFADNKLNGQFAGFVVNQNDSATAVVAGGQVGCDLQVARNWVIGAQIDGAWTHLSGSERLTGSQGLAQQGHLDLAGNLIINANVIATYDFNGKTSATTCAVFDPTKGCTAFNAPVSSAFDFNAPSANRFGWTIGVGTEWAGIEPSQR